MSTNSTRYQVFCIRQTKEKEKEGTVWVKAGSAWMNRDGSMNVYLDVLPLDGKLHIRESADKLPSTTINKGDET